MVWQAFATADSLASSKFKKSEKKKANEVFEACYNSKDNPIRFHGK